MKDIEKMFRQEKLPISDFIVETINQLADEQDFDIEADVEKGNIQFHFLSIPKPGDVAREFPTEEDVETFMGVAIGRMRDMYPQYDWVHGLHYNTENHGFVMVYFNEDTLGIE